MTFYSSFWVLSFCVPLLATACSAISLKAVGRGVSRSVVVLDPSALQLLTIDYSLQWDWYLSLLLRSLFRLFSIVSRIHSLRHTFLPSMHAYQDQLKCRWWSFENRVWAQCKVGKVKKPISGNADRLAFNCSLIYSLSYSTTDRLGEAMWQEHGV